MPKVFLGGTRNNTTWREKVIDGIEGYIDYYNPIVEDWTPECKAEEDRQKDEECNIHVYVITSAMTGVYSIAEIIDSVYNVDKKTFMCVIHEGFEDGQLKSLDAVGEIVKKKGGVFLTNIDDLIDKLRYEATLTLKSNTEESRWRTEVVFRYKYDMNIRLGEYSNVFIRTDGTVKSIDEMVEYSDEVTSFTGMCPPGWRVEARINDEDMEHIDWYIPATELREFIG